MRVKKSSGILVTFSGLPYTTSNFFLDNGMANLAGALIANGHDVQIMDYNTPEIWSDVLMEDLFRLLQHTWIKFSMEESIDKVDLYKAYNIIQEQIGYNFKVFNERAYAEISRKVIERHADFVGFKLWLGRGVHSSIYLAEKLKRRFPKLKIFSGGPLAQLFTEQLFDMTKAFDAIAVGEAEMIISDLANYAVGRTALAGIPNLAYLDHYSVKMTKRSLASLNDLPSPCYDEEIYPAAHNSTKKIKVVTMDESRGCNRNCAFCTHGVLGGRPVRTMSVGRIIQEFKRQKATLGTNVFNLGGSCVPYDLIKKITESVKKEKLDLIFNCFMNAEDIKDTSLLDDFRDGGLFSVFYGIESLDKEVLHRDYLKFSDPKKITHNIKATLASGIYVTGSVIYPAPTETFRSSYNTLNNLTDIFRDKPNGAVMVFYPGLMPHTTWSKDLARFNIACQDLQQHFSDFLRCEIRHFLPMSFWEYFSYKINGRNQQHLAILADKFSRALNRRGVSTNAMGDSVMLGYMINKKPKDFKSLLSELFFTGDAGRLEELISDINHAISKSPPKWNKKWIQR